MFESVTKKRKNTTPWWVVIPVMLAIAALIAVRTCRMMRYEERDLDRRLEQEQRKPHDMPRPEHQAQ